MKIMLVMSIILSFNFMFMKHPLSMGLILLLQTILSCVICSYNMVSYMFSYILFLIFIGGMLILFMYMSSIASNESFIFSMKLMLINLILIFIIIFMIKMINLKSKSFYSMMEMYNDQDFLMLNKLFLFPSGILTLMMVLYLLFTLIVVVNMVSLKIAPLRAN